MPSKMRAEKSALSSLTGALQVMRASRRCGERGVESRMQVCVAKMKGAENPSVGEKKRKSCTSKMVCHQRHSFCFLRSERLDHV